MTDHTELLNAKLKTEKILLGNTGSIAGVGANLKEDSVNVYLRTDNNKNRQHVVDLLGSTKSNGHEIIYIESGEISALGCPCNSTSTSAGVSNPFKTYASKIEYRPVSLAIPTDINRTIYTRPLSGGMSIGSDDGSTGTAGVLVYETDNLKKYILSNNHVFAKSSTYSNKNAQEGDSIFSPGCIDSKGCNESNIIGSLYKYIPLNETEYNFIDAALTEPTNTLDISDNILGIGKVTGYIKAQEGMRVIKSGRTTGISEGIVKDTNASLEVNYGSSGTIKFQNAIVTSTMASGGDSGSLVLEKDTNKATGLLFAGSQNLTVSCNISYVSEMLGISLLPSGDTPLFEETEIQPTMLDEIYRIGTTAVIITGTVSTIKTIENKK